MAAEAYNEIGNTPEAWRLLNEVRLVPEPLKPIHCRHTRLHSLISMNFPILTVVMRQTISVLLFIGNAVLNWLLKVSVNMTYYVGVFWVML